MLSIDEFLYQLMDAAKREGLECAEASVISDESFECKAARGQIIDYSVNDTRGVGFRGMVDGKIGYAATEALDEEAIVSLVQGVKESAALSEDDSGASIFEGENEYPEIEAYNPQLDKVSTQEKLDACLAMEKNSLAFDNRIESVPYCLVGTGSVNMRLTNSYGLDVSFKRNNYVAYIAPIAKDGDSVATGEALRYGDDFSAFNAQDIAREAGEKTLFMLHAKSLKSGSYRVIFKNEAMSSLLRTFSGVFSAENAHEGLSLLKGKEGEKIASEEVTLLDDPLLKNGPSSKPFDAEGVACHTKTIIENGVLTTLLHNRKTAKRQGMASTGNAGKNGYAGNIRVTPTNFFFKPGQKSLSELEEDMVNGLVITDLEGLHSGANAVSGDFSLSAKGYTVKDGKKTDPIEQITVAGNFYTLLEGIRAVGNDLVFQGSGIASPSIDSGMMMIAGE